MFQRGNHVFQHGAVDFRLLATDQQLGAFAQLLSRLPHHSPQPRDDAAESHHASAHQTLLDFLVDLGLLVEQRADLAGLFAQGVTNVAQVVGDFHQRAAELLQLGETIQFQRIEFQLVRLGARILSRLDTGFGLRGEMGHLPTQSDDGLLQLVEVEAHRVDALIDPGAENAALAHLIDQGIEQRGADADAVGGRGGGRFFRGLRHRRHSGGSDRGCKGFGRCHGFSAQYAVQLVDQILRVWRWLAATSQHAVQAVQGMLDGVQDGRRGLQRSLA